MPCVDFYKRGRRFWGEYKCQKCQFTKLEKGNKIPNNPSRGVMSKGCSIPWGKDKRTKFNPKKKRDR